MRVTAFSGPCSETYSVAGALRNIKLCSLIPLGGSDDPKNERGIVESLPTTSNRSWGTAGYLLGQSCSVETADH